ncbi:MAG: hypothetical protein M1824_003112 [Vezdaea acicularis]|nr:MAG: hypothetical protein M1824_003112 [Vezdaea acicularis]
MFIGGLNWETTDQSLKDYFSQFGEVLECTVMRDSATGRSRGFGFLTFKDARTVNIVMVKEHFLDGKIIDPKRAIPRDEQERTSKIFVGGVSQEASEQDFKEYFTQFGRVLDATLMMDKDTGRPRGFGFVTFDSEAAVDATLASNLEILGKPIEVKKAQPRGNVRDDEDKGGNQRFNRRGNKGDEINHQGNNANNANQQNQNQQNGQSFAGGMTPQMMAQYWQRMQQAFAMMQQQMAASRGMAPMGMGGMNPAMMAQMQQMQAMAAMNNPGAGSQSPQSPGTTGMNAAMTAQMTPQMMQQMQQMQNMQQMQQMQAGAMPSAAPAVATPVLPTGPQAMSGGGGNGGTGSGRGTPGYNAYEQQLFEQQKYEQQQARRAAREQQQQVQQAQYAQFQGGPTSWEGMYDEVPQPNMGGQAGVAARGGGFGAGRQMTPNGPQRGNGANRGSQGPPQPQLPVGPQSAPPANAPTGPKNAGKPGANYRGGGRAGHRGGFHPYARG